MIKVMNHFRSVPTHPDELPELSELPLPDEKLDLGEFPDSTVSVVSDELSVKLAPVFAAE
jgi:hypothetical protein